MKNKFKVSLKPVTLFSTLFITSHLGASEKPSDSYLEMGVTASMFLLPTVGYWKNGIGSRISGMYLDRNHHEYYLNIGYELSDAGDIQHSINILTSRVVGSDPGADYSFAATGLAYGLNYKGFFLEYGLAVPWRDDIGNLARNSIIPSGYWGYIHRFK